MWVYIAIALAIFAAGATSGYKVESWRWAKADLDRERMESAEQGRKLAAADLGAVKHEGDKVVIRKEFVDRQVEVERVVTVDKIILDRVCLSDAGLRIIASSISGSSTASIAPSTMPGTATTATR